MTLRAVITGFLFAVFISIAVYFNDHIIQQTFLIGNHFPVIVFGSLIMLVILVNPVLKLLKVLKPLSAMEIAVIGAFGLSVCGWPGSGYFRGFSGLVVKPSTQFGMNASWKAAHVMSYVPGASFLLGEGHIAHWEEFSKELISDTVSPSPARRLWELMPQASKVTVISALARGNFQLSDKSTILAGINEVIANPPFYKSLDFEGISIPLHLNKSISEIEAGNADEKTVEKTNRLLLDASFLGLISPPPPGKGVLLADSDTQNPAVEQILTGSEGLGSTSLSEIPWETWMPTLFIWGGLALLLGIASVCLAVVFQPQWKREMLPFPIARFVSDLTHSEHNDSTPAVLRNKLFWYSFLIIFVFHLVNGLHAWFPGFLEIPLRFDFSAMQQLFPRARQVELSSIIVWNPQLFPSVIAIAFFLSAEVSFSLGISGFIFMAFMSIMMASGVAMERDYIDSGNENLIRFGSYLGMAVMFLYTGRRYYTNVVLGSLGLKRHSETPLSAVWASRILVICITLAVVLLSKYGVDWFFGLPMILSILLMFVVMSRVNAETGSFFMQSYWMPLGVISALFGVKAIGPTAYVIMAMMSMILVGDPREIIMPFVTNALYMGTDPTRKKPSGGFAMLIGFTVVAGFLTALCATLYFQYNKGINSWDWWAMKSMPELVFDHLTLKVSELSAYGELSQSVAAHGIQKLSLIAPNYNRITWMAGGLSVVVLCSMLRLKFAWWPLHPVAFIVFGTYTGAQFTASFLIGWLIKTSVVKMSGAKGFRTVKPLMIGLIAGELFSAMGWSIFGTVYFLVTDLVPKIYRIFPG